MIMARLVAGKVEQVWLRAPVTVNGRDTGDVLYDYKDGDGNVTRHLVRNFAGLQRDYFVCKGDGGRNIDRAKKKGVDGNRNAA